jgi:hypothetical protein
MDDHAGTNRKVIEALGRFRRYSPGTAFYSGKAAPYPPRVGRKRMAGLVWTISAAPVDRPGSG